MYPATFVSGFSDEEETRKMIFQPLGETNLKLSKLSLGAGAFGGAVFYGNEEETKKGPEKSYSSVTGRDQLEIVEIEFCRGCASGGAVFYGDYDIEEASQTVINAIRSGINFIDAGPHYGLGKAETFLGMVLKQIPRNSYYISTKVGRMGTYFNFTSESVTKSFEESLRRLQLDKVDIVFVHDVEFANSLDIILRETLPTVQKFVELGKANFIGISGYPLTTLLEVVSRSEVKIDCVLSYSRDTLIDNTLQDFLPLFQNKGVGVMNAGCIGMKLLTNDGPFDWHPASREVKEMCSSAGRYCQENGVELGRLACYHALNQSGSCTCIVGMNDMKTLQTNLDILHNGLRENELKILQNIREKYFSPNKKYHWEGVELRLFREKNYI